MHNCGSRVKILQDKKVQLYIRYYTGKCSYAVLGMYVFDGQY